MKFASVESGRRCIDTALPSPDDILPWPEAPLVTEERYPVRPRSLVLLALALPGAGVPLEVIP